MEEVGVEEQSAARGRVPFQHVQLMGTVPSQPGRVGWLLSGQGTLCSRVSLAPNPQTPPGTFLMPQQ